MSKASNCREVRRGAQGAGQRIFPLDEELELLPGLFTPRLQEAMTRLGSKLPFGQVVEELAAFYRTTVSEPTVRRNTYQNGQASEAVARQEAERIEAETPTASAQPEQVIISADGAFIALNTGEWREVKTVVVGEFAKYWNANQSKMEVRSDKLSYFSRTYPAREFERYALAELHRRGLERAGVKVAVNDGSAWIQSFIDYHCPKAVRIIDFAHAQSYVAKIGRTILGEESAEFPGWFRAACHQVKHEPPQRFLPKLTWFGDQAQGLEQETAIDHALRYLRQRQEMIDYRHFRHKGYPIGSGSVESSHKVVVHSRLKQAGMRWAEQHVNPLLALRNNICNDRWTEGWQAAVTYRRQQRWQARRLKRQQPVEDPPTTNTNAPPTPKPTASPKTKLKDCSNRQPYRPADDHPWRLYSPCSHRRSGKPSANTKK
jgi:hypothetical protein